MQKRTIFSVQDAVKKVMDYSKTGEIEIVSIEESDGRFLAEDLIADHPVPPFDRSPYDGFAIRAEDSKLASSENPLQFEVIDEIGAGSVSEKKVGSRQAIRIMTGAQIPDGSDAVVMLELTSSITKNGQTFMSIKRAYKQGDNISFKGEDTKKGTVLVKKGMFINPGMIALLATFGYSKVSVAKKPVVGLIATGSELLEVDERLVPGKIRNSNSYMIQSQLKRSGAEPLYLGKLSDDFDQCFSAVEAALKKVDLLITTGGVSVGDYDFLPAIYEKLGANVLFNKIGMRPGSVTTVAEKNGKLLFGLSGNPSACYVGFELLVRPVVRTYLFSEQPHLFKTTAQLKSDFPKANPFTRFVRGSLVFKEGNLFAAPVGLDKSNVVTSLAGTNILIVLPGGTRGYQAGMNVDVILLEDQAGSVWPWQEYSKS
ncbi:gephyrin-like molybdotransferase Glp [Metabacillus herbersteinensis]|uniref:Molybdopterin molybdenumtransferase n=1 Tax=Metabacillus herbersteinensis TaxID=283816 RepID=A0ABV6GAQ6_9BACI